MLVVAGGQLFFIVSLAFLFFLCCYALFAFVEAEIQSESIFVRSEIQFAVLFHRAIVMLQLLELTSRGFAIVYRFRHIGRAANQGASNIGRKGNMPSRLAVDRIRFFVDFFLFLPCHLLQFHAHAVLVLAFIAAQTAAAAALSLRAESLAITLPRALSTSILSVGCLSVRLLLCEYAMSCSRHAASSGFCPRYLWLIAS